MRPTSAVNLKWQSAAMPVHRALCRYEGPLVISEYWSCFGAHIVHADAPITEPCRAA